MAEFFYTEGLKQLLTGSINLESDDIRAVFCMSNTTADTDEDAATIDAIGTLDEHDGHGFGWSFAQRTPVVAPTVDVDTTNNRARFLASQDFDVYLNPGTRDNASLVIYKHGTSDADSIPLIHFDLPVKANGQVINIAVPATGYGYLEAA